MLAKTGLVVGSVWDMGGAWVVKEVGKETVIAKKVNSREPDRPFRKWWFLQEFRELELDHD